MQSEDEKFLSITDPLVLHIVKIIEKKRHKALRIKIKISIIKSG